MGPESEKTSENANTPPPSPVQERQAQAESSGEKAKSTRHPRWTREETIILIEAKKAVEDGGGGRRVAGAGNESPFGSDHLEPKWRLVSSCCKRQGVNRTPVQCQKRWGNILSDFRKIKKWESSVKEEGESFWMMRNDERRERKLPGFFDGEVYNVLVRKAGEATAVLPLTTLIETPPPQDDQGEEEAAVAAVEEDLEAEAIFDAEKTRCCTEEEAVEAKRTADQLNAKEAAMEEAAQKRPTHSLPNSGMQNLAKFPVLLRS